MTRFFLFLLIVALAFVTAMFIFRWLFPQTKFMVTKAQFNRMKKEIEIDARVGKMKRDIMAEKNKDVCPRCDEVAFLTYDTKLYGKVCKECWKDLSVMRD